MTVFTIKGDKVYLIGFIAKAENHSSYLSTLQTMFDSLKLLYPATNLEVYSVDYLNLLKY
jgi:hypothetical protein